jgi:DNA-binding transcriptional LysR family regulator
MSDLEELRALIALAEFGTVSKAAENLGTSRSRLRRKLASLEELTATELFTRVDGMLIPTEAGASLIEGGKNLLDEAALLFSHTREIGNEPSGLLRVGMPPGFPVHVGVISWKLLRETYKNVRVEFRIAENPITLLPEEVDLVVTVDEDLEVPNCTRLEVVRLQYQLLATETYLSENGNPTTPEELKEHDLFTWRPPSNDADYLHLADGGRFQVQPAFISTNERFLFHLVAEHQGIAYLPCPPFPEPDYPGLVPVLPDMIGRAINGQMFVPNALLNVPRVKAVWDAAVMVGSEAS